MPERSAPERTIDNEYLIAVRWSAPYLLNTRLAAAAAAAAAAVNQSTTRAFYIGVLVLARLPRHPTINHRRHVGVIAVTAGALRPRTRN